MSLCRLCRLRRRLRVGVGDRYATSVGHGGVGVQHRPVTGHKAAAIPGAIPAAVRQASSGGADEGGHR
jgi:hypothetical protein